jgi:hypothetical protein
MDSGPVAGKPENFAPNLRVGVKNAYNNFKSTAPAPAPSAKPRPDGQMTLDDFSPDVNNTAARGTLQGSSTDGTTTTGFDRLKEASKVGVQSFNDSAKNSAIEANQNANQQYIQDQANQQIQADRQKQAIDAEVKRINEANAVSGGN